MKILLSVRKQIRPLLHIQSTNSLLLTHKEKVVVVMGATGAGKSRLSIDLATRLTPRLSAEVINSDKMQVYRGLNIATNKITDEERCGVPHHLLGVVDPESDYTAEMFRDEASNYLGSILRSKRLPIIVGGSNSFLEKLVDLNFRSKYDCCFLWVHVAMPVLHSFISDRVDKMIARGMVNEVRDFYKPNADYSRGIRRAIGVPEFDNFFRVESFCDAETRARILAEAINSVKMNTSRLASIQLQKIHRLKSKGWTLHLLDATDVFRKRGGEAEAAWEYMVAGPGEEIVSKFLSNSKPAVYSGAMAMTMTGVAPPLMATVTAAPY